MGCGPAVRVKTASDPHAQPSKYHTFAMLEPNKPVPSENADVDPFVLQRLRQLTYLKLKEKGYRPVAKRDADLLVGVIAARDTRYYSHPTASYGFGYGYGYGYGPYMMRPGWTDQVGSVDESVVVIDLVESSNNAVVWRGTGVKALDGDVDEKQLGEIVNAILAEYPSLGSSSTLPEAQKK